VPASAEPAPVEEPPLPHLPPTEPLSLENLMESLLFVAEGPVPVARLAEALEVSPREVEAALGQLTETYLHRGLSVQRSRDKVQLTTTPAAADKVQRFLGLAAATPLSRAALETLAIIAYRQPITRAEIEQVRGVNVDGVMQTLVERGLVEQVGRAEVVGRPMTYGTTVAFVEYFGLRSLEDLPAADELRRVVIQKPESLVTAEPGLATVPPEQLALPTEGQPSPGENQEAAPDADGSAPAAGTDAPAGDPASSSDSPA
jgi:segregation and condensation protein B